MYIEILHEVVQEILSKEGDKKVAISIELTPFIYKTLQYEMNFICKFNTEVPIESVNFHSVTLYGRTITISSGKELNDKFEMKMVERLTQLAFNTKKQ